MLDFTACLFLYLCGSIPFGLLFGHLFKTEDIRKIGSGNIGATNMLRTGNKWAALLTLICDLLKGFLPILLLKSFVHTMPSSWNYLYIIPVLGHIFPFWLKFKGGKGVATGLGVIFAYSWQLGLTFISIWIVVAVLLRTSSLSALVAFTILPLINCYLVGLNSSIWLITLTLLIFYTHRDNIKKIVRGQEIRIGASSVKNKRKSV
jgi:glycerol-3-phosphate acyltransferase PlsY